MANTAQQYGVWSLFLLLLVIGGDIATCVFMYIKDKHTQAFKIRHPKLTMAFTFSLALFLAIKNFVTKVYPSQSFLLWDVISSINLAGFCPSLYFIRTWKILFDSETIAARSRRSIVAHSWFLSHQDTGSDDAVFWAVLISFAVHNIVAVIVAAAVNAIGSTAFEGYGVSETKAGIAGFIFVMFYVLSSFFMGLRVGRNVPQSETYYWLKIEICSSMLVVIIFVCTWIAMISMGRSADGIAFLNVVCSLILAINVFGMILGSARDGKQARMFNSSNPTQVKKMQSKTSANSPAKEADLNRIRNKYEGGIHMKELFDEPDLLERFREFLEAEVAVENLLFIEDVERFRHNCKDAPESRVKDKAKVIFDKYLAKNAPYPINLDSTVLQDLRTVYFAGNATIKMFDEAQREIMDLMEKDSFRRFLQALNIKFMSMSESKLSV